MSKKCLTLIPFLTLMFVFLVGNISPAMAQTKGLNVLNFTANVSPELENVARDVLKDKIKAFQDKYGMGLYLFFAFDDLNFDGKNEIFIQFREQYDFQDKYGNMDTHVFAQTSKGFYQILEVQVDDIATGRPDKTGLKKIYAFKKPRVKKPVIYHWDGKKAYNKE